MNVARYYFFDANQWGRIAEYWLATKGALPAPCVAEGDRVLQHWYESGQGEPPADYMLVDAEGRILRWVRPSAMQWVRMLFAAAEIDALFPRRPMWENREAELMQEVARRWH